MSLHEGIRSYVIDFAQPVDTRVALLRAYLLKAWPLVAVGASAVGYAAAYVKGLFDARRASLEVTALQGQIVEQGHQKAERESRIVRPDAKQIATFANKRPSNDDLRRYLGLLLVALGIVAMSTDAWILPHLRTILELLIALRLSRSPLAYIRRSSRTFHFNHSGGALFVAQESR